MASLGPFDFKGMDLTSPINRLRAGYTTIASNIRAYQRGGVTLRNLLTGALYTLSAAVHSIRRLNDSTPNGPSSGYSIINGAGTVLSLWNSTIGVKNVATGLSGNPVSIVPFRPNTSVQPVGYIGDSAPQGNVTLSSQYLGANATGPAGTPVSFVSNGMMKVLYNDGYSGIPTPSAIAYKSGIEEPQAAPIVSTEPSIVSFGSGAVGNLLATAIPWTNNPNSPNPNSSYNYGETNGWYPGVSGSYDGTAPYLINCANASYITITELNPNPSSTLVINSTTITTSAQLEATSSGRVGSTFPGHFAQLKGEPPTNPTSASYVMGAFVDSTGAVVNTTVGWIAPLYIPVVVDVGANVGNQITVPNGAVSFQIGMNSAGNSFNSNSGSISIAGTVTTLSLPTVTSILGNLELSYFGDSPIGAGMASYIWKNPEDPGGSGPTRSTSGAAGSTTGNSFIFDCSFGSSAYQFPSGIAGLPPGIPGLNGIGNSMIPMQWSQLDTQSVVSGSLPVFSAPITNTYPGQTNYTDFNFCLTGNLYFPSAGQYTFVLTSKDDVIWGIGGGVTLVSASSYFNIQPSLPPPPYVPSTPTPTKSDYGQTITVLGGYPLLPRAPFTEGNAYSFGQTTVVVYVPTAGIYPIEVDYDYWNHSGRILLLMASPTPSATPTIIPPLPSSVRQDVQYRYVYRSSATGAQSNPSPESSAQALPVLANTVTSYWSPDPQIDFVDYYRVDSATANFTYVNTGPNDNLGSVGGTNTPVEDSLTDTELGTQLLDYDNYEPFPSIDLPQKGICNVSGGIISYVSGGAIGGSSTGFNSRWLAGTEILIGSPTSLAYTLIARPVVTSASGTSSTSNTSVGSTSGGGSPWTNPGNIDSSTNYASVILGTSGGGTYYPSSTTGSVSASQSGSGSNTKTLVFSGFTSVAETSATAYITLSGTFTVTSPAGGAIILSYSVDGGVTFTQVTFWASSFSSTIVPIVLVGITNIASVQIMVTCVATSSGGTSIVGATVTNALVSVAGSGSPSSQTLSAAITNLSAPIGADISGFSIAFDGYYVGALPSLTASLSVGTESDSFSLTTSSAPYSAGSSTDLWGYGSWTLGTLTSLLVNFNASASAASTVYLNNLVVTVYYPSVAAGSTITIPGVPDGTNLTYQIPEPILAAQPLPYMWGPTDNINYVYAVGDPLRPGTLYWCKGSNLDAAPDTNQQDVTDPSEPLVNGAIAGGLGVLFSITRGWLILPNFSNATATATGTTGSTWTLQESSITRGLYIPRCVCVSGGGNIFFRVNDGIHVSSYGSASQSITDESLYPLFSHENSDTSGSQPSPITRNGITIYPPDDTLPNLQRFSVHGSYIYYDYQGTNGNPYTLVFDEAAMGWILDTYTPSVTIHAPNDGVSQQGVLVGCKNGDVRLLSSGGTEVITGIVDTPAFGGKGYMHCGMAVVEYSSTSTVSIEFFVADEGNNSYAPQTITLPSTGGQLTKYFFKPSAAKWKLLTARFFSSVPFVLNFQGVIFYLRAWGSSGSYVPTPIFGEAGGEG